MRGSPFLGVSAATQKSMRGNRAKDTKPEMLVRRLVHGMGYRYRLHRSDLPGKPDLSFGPLRKAIFVNGCFWHLHSAATCVGARMPTSRADYWRPKLEGNKARDERNRKALEALGWGVLTLWECELRDVEKTASTVDGFLGGKRRGGGLK